VSAERQFVVRAYIATVAFIGAVSFAYLWIDSSGSLDWGVGLFLLLALALELGGYRAGKGGANTALSVSFIAGLATALLFGGFSAAVVVAGASVVPSVIRGIRLDRLLFNLAQQTVAVGMAWFVYRFVGGVAPAPSLALVGEPLGVVGGLASLLQLFVLASVYLVVNSVLVSIVVSLSSGVPLRDHWRQRQPLLVGLDFGGTAVAFLVAMAYTFADQRVGSGLLGLVIVAVPILISRKSALLVRALQQSSEDLLRVMVKAIEARDPYTSGHSVRVQALAVALGADLGLSASDRENLATAALLHDVGKIHEEFAPILRKEGKLTIEERELMESHAERGATLVHSISRFRGAIENAIRHHHERWDGMGYPMKLAGEEIPLVSRVIHVADTIDSMTTDRPYRARLSFEVVVAELRRHSGAQFDPRIAECAISSLSVRRLLSDSSVYVPTPAIGARDVAVLTKGEVAGS